MQITETVFSIYEIIFHRNEHFPAVYVQWNVILWKFYLLESFEWRKLLFYIYK